MGGRADRGPWGSRRHHLAASDSALRLRLITYFSPLILVRERLVLLSMPFLFPSFNLSV